MKPANIKTTKPSTSIAKNFYTCSTGSRFFEVCRLSSSPQQGVRAASLNTRGRRKRLVPPRSLEGTQGAVNNGKQELAGPQFELFRRSLGGARMRVDVLP